MKTKAAILWGLHEKWQVEEVELDPPKSGEVLVKLTASGLCHSDYHLAIFRFRFPLSVVTRVLVSWPAWAPTSPTSRKAIRSC